jgi:hypothetical protein
VGGGAGRCRKRESGTNGAKNKRSIACRLVKLADYSTEDEGGGGGETEVREKHE